MLSKKGERRASTRWRAGYRMGEKVPIWNPGMSDEERKAVLDAYVPEDHLTSWEKGGEALMYYPAAWRLYELKLRFPKSIIKTEIIEKDRETNFILLKGYLWIDGEVKAEAMKQGLLSKTDAVETAVKARCARDFGISPTLALDMEDSEIAAVAKKAEAEHEAKKKAARERRQTAERPAATSQSQKPTGQQNGYQPAKSGPEAKKALACQMAERLGLRRPPIENLTEQAIDDLISQYKQENAQRQRSAKVETAARAELEAAKKE